MHNSNLIQVLFFIGFILIISGLLVLDLGVFEKKDKVVSIKRAFVTTLIWIFLAIGFGCIIYFFGNQIHGIEDKQALVEVANKYHEKNFETKISDISFDKAVQMYNKRMFLEYITGYLIEYSLSIDNIFVMILIFSAFAVPPQYYKRVLMWGIVGAMIMRFIFIFVAGALISKYEWILILFGLFLIYSGISMFLKRNKKEEMNPDKNPIVRFCSKRWNVTNEINDNSFVKKNRWKKIHNSSFALYDNYRIYRCYVCCRFYSSSFFCNKRPLYCIFLKYLCYYGLTFFVLPYQWYGKKVQIFKNRSFFSTVYYRSEDDIRIKPYKYRNTYNSFTSYYNRYTIYKHNSLSYLSV